MVIDQRLALTDHFLSLSLSKRIGNVISTLVPHCRAQPRDRRMIEMIQFHFAVTVKPASDMKKEHRKALVKGLPYPILTITEYLSQDAEGFCWGRRYRLAGHYANFLLW